MAQRLRIMLALLGVAAAGMLLCATLVFGSLDRLSLRTAEDNIDFLLTQLRDTVEANVNLGLPLASARVVQNLIERAKAADERVLAVEVFSRDGRSLFNTDRGSIGETIPAAWQVAVRNRILNGRWRVEELGDIVVGETIRNDFGEAVGYLALTVSGQARDVHAAEVTAALVDRSAVAVPAALAALAVFVMLVLERSSRDVVALADRLGERAAAAGPDPLAAAAASVHARVDAAAADFERATSDVLKADDV